MAGSESIQTPTYLQAGLEPGETPFELSNDSFSSPYTGEKNQAAGLSSKQELMARRKTTTAGINKLGLANGVG